VATEVFELSNLVFAGMRLALKQRRGPISLAQLPILFFLRHHSGASLSEVARHLGMGLPAASRLVDGLVGRNMVDRVQTAADRRFVALSLTASGVELLQSAEVAVRAGLAQRLSTLPPEELGRTSETMVRLGALLTPSEGEQPEC
jgi:DNA-binding MarR family transcriptional regulator